jgi:putative ABC transport system permease protein
MEAIIRRMAGEFPEGNEGRHAHVETRAEVVTGHVRDQLVILMAAVGLLLIIACTNLAGLTVARGEDRGREMALKAALGASRGRLVRGLFMESLTVALAGALLAIPMGGGMLSLILAFGPADLPRRSEVSLDPVTVAFAFALAVGTALLLGLLPALRSSRKALAASLKEGGERGTGRTSRLQQGLVIVQVALACVLLSGAGLLSASLLRLQAVEKGFNERGVLSFRIQPPGGSYEAPEALSAFYDGITERLQGLPGVTAVGATWALPLSGSFASSAFQVEGRPDGEEYLLQLVPVRGDYFRAMEIPIVEGRGFQAGDGGDGRLVTVVNRTLAQRIWPGEDAVGKRLRKGTGPDAALIEVVGVVPDQTLQTLGEDPLLQTFWPHRATPWARELFFTLRTEGDPLSLVSAARQAVAEVDARVPLADVGSMTGRVDRQLSGPRFRTFLVGVFAVVAGLLSVLGIYGLTAFVVARRTREIGVRMALGARKGAVTAEILGRGLRLTGVGLVLGLAGAVVASRVAGTLLFRTEPLEPLVFAGAGALLVAATLAAAWLPARRAAGLDPVSTLRE